MKKTFLIVAAIAFGATSAVIIASIALLATGMVKRSLFGGYTFAFETPSAASSDYDRKSAIAKGLIVANAALVDGDDARMKKIVCDITNPNDELAEDLVSFNILLMKAGKVTKILTTVESITIKKGETKRYIIDLIVKEPVDYDAIEVLSKG